MKGVSGMVVNRAKEINRPKTRAFFEDLDLLQPIQKQLDDASHDTTEGST